MEQLVEDLTRGNVTEVKVVLASIAAALAVYQVILITVGYGKVRLPFVSAGAASWTHRASGDAILVLVAAVALGCLGYYGLEDDGAVHAVTGAALIAVLAVKVAVIRWWHGLSRFLPVLGTLVFVLLAVTWFTSAGHFLADGET
ncbi:MAG: hypothetical protein QOD55_544 [Solirubrobacteraceae bacterium]|jgi:hypothetical protein|nr:hypothetical protein [Solirubrobacteraceae bacterium]MEA2288547.1 hypothetical protein [Solirubrobacteraceae bacterium]